MCSVLPAEEIEVSQLPGQRRRWLCSRNLGSTLRRRLDPDLSLQPGVPEGTPVVPPLDLLSCPRRNRRSPTIRSAFTETIVRPDNFILPVFVHDGERDIPIDSMPGVARLGWRHGLIDAVAEARSYGVNQVRRRGACTGGLCRA